MVTQNRNRIARYQIDQSSIYSDRKRMTNLLAVAMATMTCLIVTTAEVRAGTTGIIYENWVIADDFCIECAECQCDVNGDGQCDSFDLLYLAGCAASPAPGCDNADVNCDGIVGPADAAIVQCLFSGQPQDVCCEPQVPLIDRVRWYGSYLDPNFEPGLGINKIDSWLIALHSDIPAQACPPTPPGTVPFDYCGTLSECPTSGIFLFTPKGSNVKYQLALDPSGALIGHIAGEMVRVCGFIDHSLTSACSIGIDTINVNDVLLCGSEVSRPNRLIAQWVIDAAQVPVDHTGKQGWDGHNIYCYTADLPNACLVHNNSDPGEIDTNGIFHPKPNKTYWISFQAAVGHTVDAACNEIATLQTVIQDYWGVHTTPPGYQRKDDAFMGTLKMGCPPESGVCLLAAQACLSGPFLGQPCTSDADCSIPGEWVYDWMHHLHCSDPLYKECCHDPTKSIDIAYYLITRIPGTCANGTTCNVDSDCNDGSICVNNESTRWCQPINPGLPTVTLTPPPSRPLPEDGIDELQDTSMTMVFNYLSKTGLIATMRGPTIITRARPANSTNTIHTEMLSMDLSGVSPLGPTTVRAGRSFGLPPSLGEVSGIEPSPFFPADSFFDVFIEVEILSLQLRSAGPVRVVSQIWEIPPSNVEYKMLVPVELVDAGGFVVGSIKSLSHFFPYNGGVNIHSDVDWANTPTEVCCEPNADGSACVGICENTTLECLAIAKQCDAAGNNCVITICDCIDPPPPPEDCHIVDAFGLTPPFDCKGICPFPPWPVGSTCNRIELDVDGDGVVDTIDCRCEGEPTGACCDELTNTCFVTLQSNCTLPLQTFHPNADCDPKGSCCYDADGDGFPDKCIVLAEVCCKDKPSSTFHPNFDCNPTGTCCYDSDGDNIYDSCVQLSKNCCGDILGSAFTSGATCTGTQRSCCVGGKCIMMDPTCCQGTVGPAGSLCTANEACCDPNTGACIDADPLCCAGFSQGVNTVCSAITEACCYTDGTCADLDPQCCDDTGGTSIPGAACFNNPCAPAVCEPTLDQQTCEDFVCPNAAAGEKCKPSRLHCDATTGCIVLACECIIDCYIDFDLVTNLPFCVSNCPVGQECALFGVDTDNDGVRDEFYCDCIDPPACKPNPILNACDPFVCPNPNEFCRPKVISQPRFCFGTTTKCLTDADCLGTFCEPQTEIITCECGPDDACHIEIDLITADPICVGTCPPGETCNMKRQDTDNNGFPDLFECICEPEVCEPLDELTCRDIVCPNAAAGEICVPLRIKCDTLGHCIVLECGCTTECHIEIGVIDPFCVDNCPVGQECAMFGVDTDNDGIRDEFYCDCIDPPACKPSTIHVACDPFVCPNPNDFCRPKVISQPRFCFQTTTKCLTDADCNLTFCEPQTEIITCECGPNDACHIEIDLITADPICVGACPPNTTCIMKREDTDNNGLPDLFECICVPISPQPTPNPTGINMARAIAFSLDNGQGAIAGVGQNYAIRIIMEELGGTPDFSSFDGKVRWAGEPLIYPEFDNIIIDPLYLSSWVHCEPYFRNWFLIGLHYIGGADLVPNAKYTVQVVHESCPDLNIEGCYSAPAVFTTGIWGDVFAPYGIAGQPTIDDVLAEVGKWLGNLNPIKPISQMQPNVTNPYFAVSIDDVLIAVNAWLGSPFQFTGPCDCPSTATCTTNTACTSDNDCGVMEICSTNGFCTTSFDLCKRCDQP